MYVWMSTMVLLFTALGSSVVEAKLKYDDRPNLNDLRKLPVKDGLQDIVAEIQNDYKRLGGCLLEDEGGNKVHGIEKAKRDDPVAITEEILRQWRLGKGKKPVTWQTLVDCLREAQLNVAADDIEGALSQEAESIIPVPASLSTGQKHQPILCDDPDMTDGRHALNYSDPSYFSSYLYRYFNGYEHFYTQNINEIGTTVPGQRGNHGYTSEGIQCSILSSRVAGSVPLYRYWNNREHFYTTNSNEIGVTTPGHVGHHGYRYEGIAGYCFPRQYHGTVPLYRYWNGADHFYTTNWHEIGTHISGHTGQHNYRCEGIACYVYPYQA